MNWSQPTFRIGQTNHYVQPGDFVWTDVIEGIGSPGQMPVAVRKPISGKVVQDGTVLLADGRTVVSLDQCRLCKKVIRL